MTTHHDGLGVFAPKSASSRPPQQHCSLLPEECLEGMPALAIMLIYETGFRIANH